MTRRDTLMRTLRGEPVSRPPVCFYEINGLDQNPDNPDPFNIYNDPSWRPLLDLARERSHRIVMRGAAFNNNLPDPAEALSTIETVDKDNSRYWTSTIRIGRRTLTARSRRDQGVDTVWSLEHLLKDTDDLKAFLTLPQTPSGGKPRTTPTLDTETILGDSGIVMLDTPDPLCLAASLFHMEDFTIIAMTEPELFHRLLQRFATELYPKTEAIAQALPGHLWRIYGPEYASPPYLPPHLFREYVTDYVKPMVEAIQRHGGFARIHSHGNLKDILEHIAATGCSGLDPIEPPPQGNVSLSYVREHYGHQMVLFGNLEASDIENLPADAFAGKVRTALREGTTGPGRGFVLMPSASPYGRHLTRQALNNYQLMIDLTEQF
ncbi:MAG: hypothetical protein A2498_12650 [Lentisphaerae bacterium RIFOXYC12_FULL_60_16]|nr:MAG: hypothetical protein A2498_12650 [Lentisphaerae bacterium RIFOXYC12_FULL_60_16]OGV79170.1 MAG: hypothetical protein A2340_05145 [Lentisphaerae bacterium RIFOXYB12_FULL_60_10]